MWHSTAEFTGGVLSDYRISRLLKMFLNRTGDHPYLIPKFWQRAKQQRPTDVLVYIFRDFCIQNYTIRRTRYSYQHSVSRFMAKPCGPTHIWSVESSGPSTPPPGSRICSFAFTTPGYGLHSSWFRVAHSNSRHSFLKSLFSEGTPRYHSQQASCSFSKFPDFEVKLGADERAIAVQFLGFRIGTANSPHDIVYAPILKQRPTIPQLICVFSKTPKSWEHVLFFPKATGISRHVPLRVLL